MPAGFVHRDLSSLCSSAPLALSSQSSEGLGHCDKDPGEGRGRRATLESTDLSIYML